MDLQPTKDMPAPLCPACSYTLPLVKSSAWKTRCRNCGYDLIVTARFTTSIDPNGANQTKIIEEFGSLTLGGS